MGACYKHKGIDLFLGMSAGLCKIREFDRGEWVRACFMGQESLARKWAGGLLLWANRVKRV